MDRPFSLFMVITSLLAFCSFPSNFDWIAFSSFSLFLPFSGSLSLPLSSFSPNFYHTTEIRLCMATFTLGPSLSESSVPAPSDTAFATLVFSSFHASHAPLL